MPYVNIKVTDEGVTQAQKQQLVQGVTQLLVEVLSKDPATTFVVINEVGTGNRGVAGQLVSERRLAGL